MIYGCEPIPSQSTQVEKKIILDNHNYEPIIGMVQLFPVENGTPSVLDYPVVSLGDRQQLFLRFDLLTDQFEYLAARIYHCNWDWKKSQLRDMEFLKEINSIRITDFDYSINTTTPYIQYRLTIPKPFISGNYLIAIHRRGAPGDILLTRKFSVVENTSIIDHQVRVSMTVSKREVNQQIDFSVNYGNLLVNSPTKDIRIVLMQNHQWDRALTNLKPTLIRPNENFMEFRLMDLSTNFSGGNEFRFVDLRTLNATGRNVSKITPTASGINAYVGVDASRGNLPYTQNFQDINGNFILSNTDLGEVPLNADYANIRFTLKAPKTEGKVYVIGRFNDWKLSDENIMGYNERTKTYETSILLKQGYYDYQYYLDASNKPEYYFEGSHFITENNYEILVYFRKPGNINDQLVGYKKFSSLIQ